MNVLLDPNILARMFQLGHVQHALALDAVDALTGRGDTPCLVPQVLYEFWVVATRPMASNGMGLSATATAAELTRLQQLFPLLADSAAIFPAWLGLVTRHAVLGKQGHDARLVAAMMIHQVTHLLTFNVADFSRFPGIVAIDPARLAVPGNP